MFTANDIYDYCRNAKQSQLESYESGDDDNDEDHQRLSTRRPNFKFNPYLIKILLFDKIMDDCLIDMLGVELEDSKSSRATIKYICHFNQKTNYFPKHTTHCFERRC